MDALFTLEVYTPYKLFYSDMVQAIAINLSDGESAVYANHVPFTAPVIPCVFKIKEKNGEWKTAFTAKGILEVNHRKTILVSDAAEWPEEIDYERAMKAKERAEQILAEGGTFKSDRETFTMALRRANMRIKTREEGVMH